MKNKPDMEWFDRNGNLQHLDYKRFYNRVACLRHRFRTEGRTDGHPSLDEYLLYLNRSGTSVEEEILVDFQRVLSDKTPRICRFAPLNKKHLPVIAWIAKRKNTDDPLWINDVSCIRSTAKRATLKLLSTNAIKNLAGTCPIEVHFKCYPYIIEELRLVALEYPKDSMTHEYLSLAKRFLEDHLEARKPIY